MKIFVIGYSRTGKTSFAKKLAKDIGFEHLTASSWLREIYDGPAQSHLSEKELIRKMTDFSIEQLKANPFVAAKFLSEKIKDVENIVIDGIRNPIDFQALFDPKVDHVILINRKGYLPQTRFEMAGIDAICCILDFYAIIDKDFAYRRHRRLGLSNGIRFNSFIWEYDADLDERSNYFTGLFNDERKNT